ncbi:hypothetical protein [Yoonia sp. R2-816]|uniref:hypothetical protein n=1 Tax=Yoonia sp. R2-816 TaxID=3342638 RepID=UPI00372D0AEA
MTASALHGSPQSIRQYNELRRLGAEKKQHDINRDVATAQRFKRAQQALHDQHIEEHGCEPLAFPHPDDIIIDPRDGVRVIGPCNHDEYVMMRNTQLVIDACLWQHALDQRVMGRGMDDTPASGALLVAMFLDETLPRREQISPSDMVLITMRREVMAKRQLLRETRQAWLDAGYIVKRGATMWSETRMKQILCMLPEAIRICNNPDIDEEEEMQALQDMIRQRMVGATD